MIVRKQLSWRRVAHYTGRETALFAGIALIITLVNWALKMKFVSIASAPLSIMGAALTVFLAFRTNSAYDRWWEARTLWGGIVNFSRTLARQTLSFSEVPTGETDSQHRNEVEAFERDMVYGQIAFAHALRCHLRKQEPWNEIAHVLPASIIDELRSEKNVPSALLLRAALRLKAAYRAGILDTFRFLALSDTLTELTNLLGGCERIKNTTLPRQYDVFPRLFVWAFCLLLPLGLVEPLGWYTVPVCTLISFIFIALDAIGSNIENPFENTIHDTPMSSLSRTIEINLRQMLGEKELPAPVEPVDGYLY